jgi:hypothetical protein
MVPVKKVSPAAAKADTGHMPMMRTKHCLRSPPMCFRRRTNNSFDEIASSHCLHQRWDYAE